MFLFRTMEIIENFYKDSAYNIVMNDVDVNEYKIRCGWSQEGCLSRVLFNIGKILLLLKHNCLPQGFDAMPHVVFAQWKLKEWDEI